MLDNSVQILLNWKDCSHHSQHNIDYILYINDPKKSGFFLHTKHVPYINSQHKTRLVHYLFTRVHLLTVPVTVTGVWLDANEWTSRVCIVGRWYSQRGKCWEREVGLCQNVIEYFLLNIVTITYQHCCSFFSETQ